MDDQVIGQLLPLLPLRFNLLSKRCPVLMISFDKVKRWHPLCTATTAVLVVDEGDEVPQHIAFESVLSMEACRNGSLT